MECKIEEVTRIKKLLTYGKLPEKRIVQLTWKAQ
jgi:hypothetical protein